MYVCLCQGVTDRDIRNAAANGARTLKDLRRELGVARDCGRCACCARDCLKEAQATAQAPQHALPGALLLQAAASQAQHSSCC